MQSSQNNDFRVSDALAICERVGHGVRYPDSVHARAGDTMTHESQPDLCPEALLLTAEVILQRLFPLKTHLKPEEIQLMTLQAGVWALQTEADPQQRELPRLLRHQLTFLRQVSEVPAPSTPVRPSLTEQDLSEVRTRFEALGQPWSIKRQLRDNVTQTSFRTYPEFMAKVQAAQGPGLHASDCDLQVTLSLAYLSLPELKSRVDALLRLRYQRALSAAELQQHPEAARVAATLQASDLPWRGRVTLRRAVRHVAMRVTTTMAAALKAAPPADLHCTVADLHTTLLALYLVDETLRHHVTTLLEARTQA